MTDQAATAQPNNRPSRCLACVAIGGVPLVHPLGHPQAGEVVEFFVRVPSAYEMTISVHGVPDCWARFHVDVGSGEDGDRPLPR